VAVSVLAATDFGYDWLAAKPIFQLQGHKRSVLKLSLTDDPWKLISLSSDKILKVWDLRVNKCVQVKPRVSLPNRPHCSTAFALAIDWHDECTLPNPNPIRSARRNRLTRGFAPLLSRVLRCRTYTARPHSLSAHCVH